MTAARAGGGSARTPSAFVTVGAGRSFQLPLALTGPMLGFAIAADGSKVYAGSLEEGLLVAPRGNGALTFHKASSNHVQCLATRGSELWVCSDEAGGFSVGVSSDDGAKWAPRLPFGDLPRPVTCAPDLRGPFACGASANASQCSGETRRYARRSAAASRTRPRAKPRGPPSLRAGAPWFRATAPPTPAPCGYSRQSPHAGGDTEAADATWRPRLPTWHLARGTLRCARA